MQIKFKRPITLLLSNGKRINACLTDISMEKIGIIYKLPIKHDAVLIANFSLPIADHIYKIKMEVKAMNNHLQTDQYHTLLHITKIPEENKKTLLLFLQTRPGGINHAA
ncbi:MAG: hypothetical protein OEX19_00975 [Gammaproteobacteria bacterium]|nr:hypothetical protein [Gammaproteobacteria bacterium]